MSRTLDQQARYRSDEPEGARITEEAANTAIPRHSEAELLAQQATESEAQLAALLHRIDGDAPPRS